MLKYLQFIKENNSTDPISLKIENIYNTLDDDKKTDFQNILGKYLVLDKKKNKVYTSDDIVVMEYWYNNMLTPVKIVEKRGHSYYITHKITDSKIKNAPEQLIHKSKIIDYYYRQEKDENKYSIDPSVRLKNAIDTLHPYIQKKLYNEINKIVNENDSSIPNTHIFGKNVFISFLKVLSALNMSDKNLHTFIYLKILIPKN